MLGLAVLSLVGSVAAAPGDVASRAARLAGPSWPETLEALDWGTGEQRFTIPTSFTPTQTSLWAGTTVGPDGTVWSGTFGGVTRRTPPGDVAR